MSTILKSSGCLSTRPSRLYKLLTQAFPSYSLSTVRVHVAACGVYDSQTGLAGLDVYPLNLVPSYRHTCFRGFHSNVYHGGRISGSETTHMPSAVSKEVDTLTAQERTAATRDEAGDIVDLPIQHPCYCSHTSVRAFKSHWLTVFAESAVPEPYWSVKWITEHVQKTSCSSTAAGLLSREQLDIGNHMMWQRTQRIPVQYIIGEWDFRNVTLIMRRPVFIPEQETEKLVGYVLTHCCCQSNTSSQTYSSTNHPLQFLDLCSGSGAVGVSLLVECPEMRGFALDISEEAVSLTQENASRNGVASRLTVVQGSVEDCPRLFNKTGGFDFIVSNPPYIPSGEVATTQTEVYRYIDHRALDGGNSGLDVTLSILSMSRHILKPLGQLWIETEPGSDIHVHLLSHPDWKLLYLSSYQDDFSRCRFHRLIRK